MTKEELIAALDKAEKERDAIKAELLAVEAKADELHNFAQELWGQKVEVDGLLAGALELLPKPKAPVVPEPPQKQCKGLFTWFEDNEENFPGGGDYSAEYYAIKGRTVAEPVKPTGPLRRPMPDRVIKAEMMK